MNRVVKRPKLTGWLVAQLGLALTLVFSTGALLGGAELQKCLALHALRHGLENQNYLTVERAAKYFDGSHHGLLPLSEAIVEEITLQRPAKKDPIIHLVKSLHALIGEPTAERLKQAHEEYSVVAASAIDPRAIPLKSQLEVALDKEAILDDVREQKRQTEEERARVIKQHALIANDLADFLSLQSEYNFKGEDEFESYEGGILAHLPKVHSLPDNIQDLASLRSELLVRGGHVKVDGVDAPKIFNQKIKDLLAASAAVATHYDSIEEDLDRLESDEHLKAAGLQQAVGEIAHQMGQILLELSRAQSLTWRKLQAA